MGVAAALADQLGAGLAADLVVVDDDELRAALGEGERGGAADAAATAGDEGDFSGEIHAD